MNKLLALLLLVGFLSLTYASALAVSSTPLENFDVNTSTGMVRYRPLNMTWLEYGTTWDTHADLPFTGGDAYIPISVSGNNWTLSIWINISGNFIPAAGATDYEFNSTSIVGKGPTILSTTSWGIYQGDPFDKTNQSQICVRSNKGLNQTCSSSNVSYGVWHNIIGTFNGTYCGLYIDSVLNSSHICSSIDAGSGNWWFGQGSNSLFVGGLDEIRIYNRTISQDEITAIYNSGRVANSSINNTRLVAWFPLYEDQGNYTKNYQNGLNTKSIYAINWKDGGNVTTLGYRVNISIVNITSALVFWDNYTLINQSMTYNQTYPQTFSFLNNQTIYVLENYNNITKGVTRQYDPLWFSVSTATTKHIASNLSAAIVKNITVTVTSCNIQNISYTPDGGTSITPAYTCSGTTMTIGNLTINPSVSSNELIIGYMTYRADISQACAANDTMISTVVSVLGIIFMAILFGIILSIVIGYFKGDALGGLAELNFSSNEKSSWATTLITIFILILIVAIFVVVTVMLNSGLCAVS